MTKSFTAISILKLRDEGKLSLDDPAERYVPEMAGLELPDERCAEASRSATCCRTPKGFPRTTRGAIVSSPTPTSSCRRCCAAGSRSRTRPASPTSTPTYGFAILGRIVTNVSKVRYADYVTREHPAPLGMTSTTLEPSDGAG